MNPQDRSVWITGASSGIGEALAHEFARRGARLILSARNEEALREVAARCEEIRPGANGPRAHVLPLDLADHDSLPLKAQEAEALTGGIDILVNNGGISQRGRGIESVAEVDRRIFAVNYFGTVLLTRAVVPGMLERGRGQVAVTSSVLGKFGAPTRSSYSASKHALHGFFDSLRAEIGDRITITTVCPGYIHTDISRHALEADGSAHGVMDRGQLKGMSSEACARRYADAVAKDRAEVVIGGLVERGGVWLARFCPPLLRFVIRRVPVN